MNPYRTRAIAREHRQRPLWHWPLLWVDRQLAWHQRLSQEGPLVPLLTWAAFLALFIAAVEAFAWVAVRLR